VRNLWTKLPITLRAIFAGFLIAAAAAKVWLLLLLSLGVQLAAIVEAIFLSSGCGVLSRPRRLSCCLRSGGSVKPLPLMA